MSKISWNVPDSYSNSFNFEVIKLPGYNLKKFPFLLMRDDYGIKIFHVTAKRLIKVKDANYGSSAGYKTLDLLTSRSIAHALSSAFGCRQGIGEHKCKHAPCLEPQGPRWNVAK